MEGPSGGIRRAFRKLRAMTLFRHVLSILLLPAAGRSLRAVLDSLFALLRTAWALP